ncbi:MAG TPA: MFS transporter, partial [Chromatiales bacterium]|nr:MFS transporter [Chromatiales bacterium]
MSQSTGGALSEQEYQKLDRAWFGHPAGLSTCFFTEMWERMSYYGMRALLILYMTEATTSLNPGMGFDVQTAGTIYGFYTFFVYFMALPGGIIADKWLGQYRTVAVGGFLIVGGQFLLAVGQVPTFFAGLVCIVTGTGLLKPNISTMVGSLYPEGDARRDGGFSIFYMGINVGAAIAPLVCGTLGQKVGWGWGFAAAGFGMILGLIQYRFGKKRLLPSLERIAAQHRAKEEQMRGDGEQKTGFMELMRSFTPQEWKRMGVIMVLFVFSVMFWAAFEQAGTSLNLFADRMTNTNVLGWNFPTTWFQFINPFYIIVFAPIYAKLWVWLDRRDKEPAAPLKFVYGMILVGLGFLLILPAASKAQDSGMQVSMFWLIGVYLLHTLGELSLSPVSLSMVTKLAPQRIVGSMMGIWFLSYALGNLIAGSVGGLFETLPLVKLFGTVFVCT